MTPELERLLDNPIWSALTTAQSALAHGNALAARFPADISPLGGMRDQSAEAYRSLEAIAAEDPVALFLAEPPTPPSGWQVIHPDLMHQMIFEGPEPVFPEENIRPLTSADISAMLALTALTEPGPFRQRTIELGGYLGVFETDEEMDAESGALAAMAGHRLHMTGFTEISAVCTHPRFQGRGYGNWLVSAVIAAILGRGETPILHVRTSNTKAVRLYERLGFRTRRQLHLAVLKKL